MKTERVVILIFLFFSIFIFEVAAAEKETELMNVLGIKLDSAKCVNTDCKVLVADLKKWRSESLAQVSKVNGISILMPTDGGNVSGRPVIKGKVTDLDSEVWVIVHPMEVSDYWVQPRTTVQKNGTWQVYVHIGQPGNIDIGKRFEIRAVANPKNKLKVGMVLSGWPKAESQSDVQIVTR